MKRVCLIILLLILLLILMFLGIVKLTDGGWALFGKKLGGMYLLADCALIDDPEYIVIPVTINSKQYRFVMDTGAGNMFFDVRLKPLLGKPVEIAKITSELRNVSFDVECYKSPDKLMLGSLDIEGVIGCHDLTKLGSPKGLYDGVVGIGILEDKVLQLDIENRRLRILKRPFLKRKNSHNKEWGVPVPLTRNFRNTPQVYIKLSNTVNELFTIDTGLRDFNRLCKNSFDKLLLQEEAETATVKYEDREDKAIVVREAHLSNIKISNMVFTAKPHSTLGTYFLKHFNMMTFDFENDKLYLKAKINNTSSNKTNKRQLEQKASQM